MHYKNTLTPLLFFMFCLLFALPVNGQNTSELVNYKLQRLEKIYRSLEYNTASFNDLKRTWIVTDPVFVREIFNKFVVKNALRVNGKKPTVAMVEEQAKSIYDGNVFIDLRKRYYDDEIEILRFFKESRNPGLDSSMYFFDPVTDFVFVKEILGEELYTDLKKQGYALNDITKSYFDYKPSYNFEAYFHVTEPELMFWSTTTNSRNKYLLSAIGRWGNEHVSLPGWYHPDYILGFKINYIDSLESNRQGYTYVGEVGLGIRSVQPDLGFEDNFAGRKLEHTGTPFYFKFKGKPLGEITPELSDVELNLTGLFTVGTNKAEDFVWDKPVNFYSTRNYFDLFLNWNNLTRLSDLGTIDAGVGVSAFDVKYYSYDPALPFIKETKAPEKTGFKYALVSEATLSNVGSLLTHSLSLQLSYNASEKILFTGVKFKFLVSNTFGFDFRVLTPIQTGSGVLPGYRSDTYMVISPIFRINY